MSTNPFLPSASIDLLKRRAQLLHCLRAFFYERDVYEVDVPVLGQTAVTDPYVGALKVSVSQQSWYLQTSPEYYMKRLLAAGMPSIYSLGKAFRQDENGARHRPEFTMLEWYSLGMNDIDLMAELEALLKLVAPDSGVSRTSYGALFESLLGICPHQSSITQLRHLAMQKTQFSGELTGKSAWLDLLFSHCVEPTLTQGFTLVSDYPVEQSALAKIAKNQAGLPVARRFELFGGGIELANGYWELTDALEQRRRFEVDLIERERLGLPAVLIDERLMEALNYGLPSCAGVALGVDRLLMVLTSKNNIAEVMPFAEG